MVLIEHPEILAGIVVPGVAAGDIDLTVETGYACAGTKDLVSGPALEYVAVPMRLALRSGPVLLVEYLQSADASAPASNYGQGLCRSGSGRLEGFELSVEQRLALCHALFACLGPLDDQVFFASPRYFQPGAVESIPVQSHCLNLGRLQAYCQFNEQAFDAVMDEAPSLDLEYQAALMTRLYIDNPCPRELFERLRSVPYEARKCMTHDEFYRHYLKSARVFSPEGKQEVRSSFDLAQDRAMHEKEMRSMLQRTFRPHPFHQQAFDQLVDEFLAQATPRLTERQR